MSFFLTIFLILDLNFPFPFRLYNFFTLIYRRKIEAF